MDSELLLKLLGVALVAVVGVIFAMDAMGPTSEPAFGGDADVTFAEDLLPALENHESWPMQSDVTAGESPHGAFVRLYFNTVQIDGENYHVIVKDNYGGADASIESISADPATFFGAMTVMVQREPGYDPENGDWFYAKYLPEGSLDVNLAGVALAGRVGKGMDAGCIPCHQAADGGDFLFRNDP